jgi:hypothetical protein
MEIKLNYTKVKPDGIVDELRVAWDILNADTGECCYAWNETCPTRVFIKDGEIVISETFVAEYLNQTLKRRWLDEFNEQLTKRTDLTRFEIKQRMMQKSSLPGVVVIKRDTKW